MNSISNKSAKVLAWLNGITFSVFYIINKILEQVIYPNLEQKINSIGIMIFITAVIAAFLYTGLFYLIKTIYKLLKFKVKSKKFDISGKWFHVHIPFNINDVDYTKASLRAGETKIKQELFDFTFMGDNYSYSLNNTDFEIDKSNATHWYTRATKFCEENDFDIIQIYEAKTKKNTKISLTKCPCCLTSFKTPKEVCEASEFRHGIHKLRLLTDNDGKCNKIDGEYSDSWPSLKRGDIIFFRSETDRNKEIENYFKKAEKINNL